MTDQEIKDVNLVSASPDDAAFDKLNVSKKLLLALGGCMCGGIAIILLMSALSNFFLGSWFMVIGIFLGYGVYAAPCLLAFVFKVGIFVDVGPMFHEVDHPVGNIIYRVTERDYAGEAAMNIGFTLLKVLIIALVSVVLTPIFAFAALIFYRFQVQKSKKYAEENGIDPDTLPLIPKWYYMVAGGAMLGALVAAIVCNCIGSAINRAESEADMKQGQEILDSIIGTLPDDWYTCTTNSQKYDYNSHLFGSTGGWSAEFMLDGKKVYAGKFCTSFYNMESLGLENNMVYYIIDGKLYVGNGGLGVDYMERLDNPKALEYCMSRHLMPHIGEGAKVESAIMREGSESYNEIYYEYEGKSHVIYTSREDNHIMYYQTLYGEYGQTEGVDYYAPYSDRSFAVYNAEETAAKVAEYKAVAQQIIEKFATPAN